MNNERPWFTLLSFITFQIARGSAVVYALRAIFDVAALQNPAKDIGMTAILALIAFLSWRELRRVFPHRRFVMRRENTHGIRSVA